MTTRGYDEEGASSLAARRFAAWLRGIFLFGSPACGVWRVTCASPAEQAEAKPVK
jgi:hypothetical protein